MFTKYFKYYSPSNDTSWIIIIWKGDSDSMNPAAVTATPKSFWNLYTSWIIERKFGPKLA
jgi:hypothetical protein